MGRGRNFKLAKDGCCEAPIKRTGSEYLWVRVVLKEAWYPFKVNKGTQVAAIVTPNFHRNAKTYPSKRLPNNFWTKKCCLVLHSISPDFYFNLFR